MGYLKFLKSNPNRSEKAFCKIIGFIEKLTDQHLQELIDYLIEIKYSRNINK